MTQFFTELAETLKDRQELRMNIKKIDGDLVVMVVPDFKNKGTTINMTGSPAEMDENFINEIKKPVSAKVEFKAETTASENEEEEEEDEEKEKAKITVLPAKKEVPKKAVAKKPLKKKEETKVDENHEKELKETLQTEENENLENLNNSNETLEAVVENLETKTTDEIEEAIKKENSDNTITDEEKPSQEELFKHFMEEGKKLFDDRKYEQSEFAYQQAVNIKPNDDKAKQALKNATAWVKAIKNLPPPQTN